MMETEHDSGPPPHPQPISYTVINRGNVVAYSSDPAAAGLLILRITSQWKGIMAIVRQKNPSSSIVYNL